MTNRLRDTKPRIIWRTIILRLIFQNIFLKFQILEKFGSTKKNNGTFDSPKKALKYFPKPGLRTSLEPRLRTSRFIENGKHVL